MSYPSINDKNFYKKIETKYKSYKINKISKSLNKICFPKEYKLQIPHKIFYPNILIQKLHIKEFWYFID